MHGLSFSILGWFDKKEEMKEVRIVAFIIIDALQDLTFVLKHYLENGRYFIKFRKFFYFHYI